MMQNTGHYVSHMHNIYQEQGSALGCCTVNTVVTFCVNLQLCDICAEDWE